MEEEQEQMDEEEVKNKEQEKEKQEEKGVWEVSICSCSSTFLINRHTVCEGISVKHQ